METSKLPIPFTMRPSANQLSLRLGPTASSWRGLTHEWAPAGPSRSRCLVAVILAGAGLASAQEALHSSMAGDEAAAARRRQQESQNYNLSWGDLRLAVAPSLRTEYNDNINTSSTASKQDVILRPMLNLQATYPLTRVNSLNFSIGIGYDDYLNHGEYSALRLEPGSQLSFDFYIKDVWINVHDRFQYLSDPGMEAALIGGGSRFGGLYNTPGVTTVWDLQDVIFTLGFDHYNFVSSVGYYDYLNRSSELPVARAGIRLHPTLTAGVEGTVSYTAYDQHVLNDNIGYSGGLYADWRPGTALQIQPRAGYALYDFSQTSWYIRAVDQSTWYADLTLSHAITDAISYSFSAGREMRLGIQADSITDWYLRPSLNWSITKKLTLRPNLSYQHGTQATRTVPEAYDWLSAGLGVDYKLVKKLRLTLDYRHALRSSNTGGYGYNQNVVGLQLSYQM